MRHTREEYVLDAIVVASTRYQDGLIVRNTRYEAVGITGVVIIYAPYSSPDAVQEKRCTSLDMLKKVLEIRADRGI